MWYDGSHGQRLVRISGLNVKQGIVNIVVQKAQAMGKTT
jgi:hypothetical protein